MNKSIDFFYLFLPKNLIKNLTDPKLLNGIVLMLQKLSISDKCSILSFLFIKES